MSYETLLKQYEQALATHQWEAVAPLIDDEACFVFSEGTFEGKDRIRQAFQKTFALIQDESYSISDLRWIHVQGGCALCMYTFHWSGQIDGAFVQGGGRGTSLLVRGSAGWKIKYEHLGPPPQ